MIQSSFSTHKTGTYYYFPLSKVRPNAYILDTQYKVVTKIFTATKSTTKPSISLALWEEKRQPTIYSALC